jgi:hypothetical protein
MAETPNFDAPGAADTEGRTAAGDAPSVVRAERMPRWRRVLVVLLVVLGCVLAPLSVLSVWMKSVVLDTDNYVSTVAPLAHNPDVQNAIADRVTNTLIVDNTSEQDLEQQVIDRLPDKAQFLGPKINDALASVVHDATLKVVQSDQFATLWEEANRRANTQIVALLEAKGSDTVQTKNGEVVLEIGPIAQKVNSALEAQGITAFSDKASSASDKQIVLIQSIWLKRSQNVTNLLQALAVALPILTLVCFGIAIYLSPNRRRTILRSALGLALGMALLLVAFNGGRHFYLNVLPSAVNQNAAGAVYDQLLGTLRLALRTGFVVALIAAIAAWLAGPAKPATRMRDGVLHLVRGTGPAGGEASALGLYVARHKNGLRVLVVGFGLVVLVALSAPTPLAVIVIAALMLLGVLLIEFLGRRATPSPETTT